MVSSVTASAKVILLGEHAVVYGQPSIAVPFTSLRAYAEVNPAPNNSGLHIILKDFDNQELIVSRTEQNSDHPLIIASKLLLDYVGVLPPCVTVDLHSDIPVASGLGSGAAITTVLLRALLQALNTTIPEDVINTFVYEVEKLYHGTPSGIDNTVTVYEKPVYFIRNQPIERLKIGKPLTLLVADTGIAASTKVAVSDVRKVYEANQSAVQTVFTSIGELVIAGRNAIELGNHQRLGSIMNDNHSLLRDLTVSSVELDNLVQAARDAGAMGAKLSGGGRGGNIIALVNKERISLVKTHLLQSGAIRVYETVVGKV